MIVKITGKHMELTDAMKTYAEKKVAKIIKFHDKVSEIEVIFDVEGQKTHVELIVCVANHTKPFVVTTSDEDAYACLDLAIDKMDRQIVKHKEKARNHKGKTGAGEAAAEVLESKE